MSDLDMQKEKNARLAAQLCDMEALAQQYMRQWERATGERDEARAEVEALRRVQQAAFNDAHRAEQEVERLKAERAPIPWVTDGTHDDVPYSLADVDAIEAARGKPYSRLRRTVEEVERLRSMLDTEAITADIVSRLRAQLRTVAERQREADAKRVAASGLADDLTLRPIAESILRTPLVTEEP